MNKKTLIHIASFSLSICLLGIAATTHGQSAQTTKANASADQDFHIDKNGNVTAFQVKVVQVAGTSFYARFYIGQAFIRMLIKTTPTTKVYRRYGDEITLKEISMDDTINVVGSIETGTDSVSIIANSITVFSNQKEVTSFQGNIAGKGSLPNSLMLKTKSGEIITVMTGPATQIKKGSRIISVDLVRNGDRITDTAGTYDHLTKTLDAQVVGVYVDKNIFKPRNFEGTLKAISTATPPTLTFVTEGKEYSVPLTSKTEVLNNKRKNVVIKRYLEGDTIRIYGAIREAEELIIDPEIIRNISLQ